MSLAQAPLPDRGASPLMSNNPFRNRIASSSPRPISTNPFLDNNEIPKQQPTATIKPVSNDTESTTDIFASLSINNRSTSPPKHYQHTNGTSRRPDNAGARPVTRGHIGHRTTASEEERRKQQGSRRPTQLDIFADPSEEISGSQAARRPRRNSESSVMDKARPPMDEEEKKRRERKYRESKRSGTTKKPSRRLDVIDKLDVTSIYGTGLFHHDGPFDACNPNRNRRRHKLAPMQAFPKDSENMKIGGTGPVNAKLDYDKFHGYSQEAHIDFHDSRYKQAAGGSDQPYASRANGDLAVNFNATDRFEPVHGDETAGLGTSTFLEGAPASKAAIQRRDSEFDHQQVSGGLSRKKSLVQKIRGTRPGGRITSPETERPPTSPLATTQSESAANPFFKDYDQDYDRKGALIAQAEPQEQQENVDSVPAKAPGSPRPVQTLERAITADAQDSKPSGGLLGRMRSLKKPRSRSERREPS